MTKFERVSRKICQDGNFRSRGNYIYYEYEDYNHIAEFCPLNKTIFIWEAEDGNELYITEKPEMLFEEQEEDALIGVLKWLSSKHVFEDLLAAAEGFDDEFAIENNEREAN